MTLFEPILLLLWAAVNIAVFSSLVIGLIKIFDRWCSHRYDWRNGTGKRSDNKRR